MVCYSGKFGAVFEGPQAEYMEARNCDLRIMPERISSLEKLTGTGKLLVNTFCWANYQADIDKGNQC